MLIVKTRKEYFKGLEILPPEITTFNISFTFSLFA